MDYDHCCWPGCRNESTMSYSVEGRVGFCQKHMEAFFSLQETKGDNAARAKVGLKPRKGRPWSAADKDPIPVEPPHTEIISDDAPTSVSVVEMSTLDELPAPITALSGEEEATQPSEDALIRIPNKRIRRFM